MPEILTDTVADQSVLLPAVLAAVTAQGGTVEITRRTNACAVTVHLPGHAPLEGTLEGDLGARYPHHPQLWLAGGISADTTPGHVRVGGPLLTALGGNGAAPPLPADVTAALAARGLPVTPLGLASVVEDDGLSVLEQGGLLKGTPIRVQVRRDGHSMHLSLLGADGPLDEWRVPGGARRTK